MKRFAAALMAVIFLMPCCGFTKAVTYQASEWAVNFWGSELNGMEEDFKEIRSDGFNTVILAVPWRQFQPQAETWSVNEEAYEKLDAVMNCAEKTGLRVMLRVGYTWDDYNESESAAYRFERLRSEPYIRKCWLLFAGKLYARASVHPCFAGGFITWEDFWNFTEDCTHWGRDGKKKASDSGYADYIWKKYPKNVIETLYGTAFGSSRELYFPSADSPARKLFYEWNDVWLNTLLLDTQRVFPGCSMEARLDVDPVRESQSGGLVGFRHDLQFSSGNAAYSSCMFSASMGFDAGVKVSSSQGVEKAREILGGLKKENGGKPVFIDQFLYTDNTPGFESNARIADGHLTDYLTGMAAVLKDYTNGYAVWTYRDYADNLIYNGEFGLNRTAWDISGNAAVRNVNGNRVLHMVSDSGARQMLKNRNSVSNKPAAISFAYHCYTPTTLNVHAAGFLKTLTLTGDGVLSLDTGVVKPGYLQLTCENGSADIDRVRLYSHITEGGIYDLDGQPGPELETLRKLNGMLPD